MTIALPTNWTPNHAPTAAELEQVLAAIRFSHQRPMARVARQAVQTLTTATVTAVTFDTEQIDNNSWFTASSTTVTVNVAGEYLLVCAASLVSNATGFRQIRLNQNGTNTDIDTRAAVNGDDTRMSAMWQKTAASGDTFSLSLYQNSGGNLNTGLINGVSGDYARMSVIWIGSGLSTGP